MRELPAFSHCHHGGLDGEKKEEEEEEDEEEEEKRRKKKGRERKSRHSVSSYKGSNPKRSELLPKTFFNFKYLCWHLSANAFRLGIGAQFTDSRKTGFSPNQQSNNDSLRQEMLLGVFTASHSKALSLLLFFSNPNTMSSSSRTYLNLYSLPRGPGPLSSREKKSELEASEIAL